METCENFILKKLISKTAFFSLLLAIVCGCSSLSNREIKSFSKQVFEGILQGNGQIVWNYSTTDFRNVINTKYGGLANFSKELSDASLAFRDLASWEIVNVIDFDDSATVQINMKYKDQFKNHRYFLYLKKEDGTWKLDRPRIMDT
jgi:hypothetical protein